MSCFVILCFRVPLCTFLLFAFSFAKGFRAFGGFAYQLSFVYQIPCFWTLCMLFFILFIRFHAFENFACCFSFFIRFRAFENFLYIFQSFSQIHWFWVFPSSRRVPTQVTREEVWRRGGKNFDRMEGGRMTGSAFEAMDVAVGGKKKGEIGRRSGGGRAKNWPGPGSGGWREAL